jgi:DNA-binding LacI/PurR family transcriptional regulator
MKRDVKKHSDEENKPQHATLKNFVPRHVTSMEVAKLAGVHKGTVSRALNRPEMVNAETLRKVMKAISDLNYRPWSQARSLSMKRHETIGLITDLSQELSAHHVELIEGMIAALTEKNHAFTMASVLRDTSLKQLLELPIVQRHSCDGFIINLESTDRNMNLAAQLDVPCIWINPSFYAPSDCIFPDDLEIAKTATKYLISKGHKNIAYLSEESHTHFHSIEQRYRGYETAMFEAELSPMPLSDKRYGDDDLYNKDVIVKATSIPLLRDNGVSEEEVEECLTKYLTQKPYYKYVRDLFKAYQCKCIYRRLKFWLVSPLPPTAIVTYSSFSAARLAQVALQENWKIPELFSLISCDNDASLDYASVPISAVDANRRKSGQLGVEMLFEKLQTGESIPTIKLKGELVERKSVLAL